MGEHNTYPRVEGEHIRPPLGKIFLGRYSGQHGTNPDGYVGWIYKVPDSYAQNRLAKVGGWWVGDAERVYSSAVCSGRSLGVQAHAPM